MPFLPIGCVDDERVIEGGQDTHSMRREGKKRFVISFAAALVAAAISFSPFFSGSASAASLLPQPENLQQTPWAVVSGGRVACYVASRADGKAVLTGLRIKYYDSVQTQQTAVMDPLVTIERVKGTVPSAVRILSVKQAVKELAEKEGSDPENAVVKLSYAKTLKEVQPVKHKTKVVKTKALEKGEKKVKVKGETGKRYQESEVVQVNSNVVKKQVMKSDVVEKPQTEVIYEGTALPAKVKGMAVIAYGKKFLGNPYVWGGESLTHGVDCSGFTMKVYEHYGITLPHSSQAQGNCGKEVSEKDMQPGDLIVYSGHVAMYAGNGMLLHAAGEKVGIILSDNIHYSKIKHIRRIFGTDLDTSRDNDFPDAGVIRKAFESVKGFGDASGLADSKAH